MGDEFLRCEVFVIDYGKKNVRSNGIEVKAPCTRERIRLGAHETSSIRSSLGLLSVLVWVG